MGFWGFGLWEARGERREMAMIRYLPVRQPKSDSRKCQKRNLQGQKPFSRPVTHVIISI